VFCSAVARKPTKPKPKPPARKKKQPVAKKKKKASASRWVKLVEKYGVMLASAAGPVLNIAEAVTAEPIIGGWWAHPKGKAIFAALAECDDSEDIRCFKLIDGKVTFVHRRIWPALAVLGHHNSVPSEAITCVQQEHMPTGEHRNFAVPFPDWVDDATAAAAAKMELADAFKLLPYLES
jgi:hypothetical protein